MQCTPSFRLDHFQSTELFQHAIKRDIFTCNPQPSGEPLHSEAGGEGPVDDDEDVDVLRQELAVDVVDIDVEDETRSWPNGVEFRRKLLTDVREEEAP